MDEGFSRLTGPEPIEGAAVLGLTDLLRWRLFLLRRRWIATAMIPLVMAVFSIAVIGIDQVNFAITTLTRIRGAAGLMLGYIVIVVLAALIFTLWSLLFFPLLDGFMLLRMGRERRALRYEIDETRITTKDALGTELLIPRDNVLRVFMTRHLMVLRVKPRHWRFLVLRAFSPADRARLARISFHP